MSSFLSSYPNFPEDFDKLATVRARRAIEIPEKRTIETMDDTKVDGESNRIYRDITKGLRLLHLRSLLSCTERWE